MKGNIMFYVDPNPDTQKPEEEGRAGSGNGPIKPNP